MLADGGDMIQRLEHLVSTKAIWVYVT